MIDNRRYYKITTERAGIILVHAESEEDAKRLANYVPNIGKITSIEIMFYRGKKNRKG